MWKLLLRLLSWKIEGAEVLSGGRPCILLIAPHTSYWDGVLGFIALKSLGIHWKTLMASWLFRVPGIGRIMTHLMGGIPVGPGCGGAGKAAIKALKDHTLVLCPEGHLRKVREWNLGFTKISRLSQGTPVFPVELDYQGKVFRVHSALKHIGDKDKIIWQLRRAYKDAKPRNPEKFELL